MEYQIKRSKRKTMVLTVLPDGHVEVRAPLKTPAELIAVSYTHLDVYKRQAFPSGR